MSIKDSLKGSSKDILYIRHMISAIDKLEVTNMNNSIDVSVSESNMSHMTEQERHTLWELLSKYLNPPERWTPNYGDVVYTINNYGEVIPITYDMIDSRTPDREFIYSTKEECELARRKLSVRRKLEDYAKAHNKEFKISDDTEKYYITYDCSSQSIRLGSCFHTHAGVVYFSSPKILMDAIQYVGSYNILKYYLDVEDEYIPKEDNIL